MNIFCSHRIRLIRNTSLAIGFLILVCNPAISQQAISQEVIQSRMESSINQYNAICERITEKFAFSMQPIDMGDLDKVKRYRPQTQNIRLVRKAKNFLMSKEIRYLDDGQTQHSVTAKNDDYSFIIDDSAIRGSYKLLKYVEKPKDIPLPVPEHMIYYAFRGFEEIQYAIEGKHNRKILSIEPKDGDTLKITISYQIGGSLEGKAEFLVATKPLYHIVSTTRINPTNRSDATIEYQRHFEGIPIPTSVDDSIHLSGKLATSRVMKYVLNEITLSDAEDLEFYLSNYGLPEPKGIIPPQPQLRFQSYILIAIGILVAMSVLFALLRHRSHRSVRSNGDLLRT